MASRLPSALAALAIAALLAGCPPRDEVIVFHAASLSRLFGELGEEFGRSRPGARLRAEPSGSQEAARKVTELGLTADLIAVADAAVIDNMLRPRHASWNIVFATNEIVLAHKDHSRFTAEVTTDNWPEVLLRAGVRLGRVDPDTAPIGYYQLLAWQLCELEHPGDPRWQQLERRLRERVGAGQVVADESLLLGLLESRNVDYAFMYRSTAEDHNLKITALEPGCHLGRFDLAPGYARASTQVRMKGGQRVEVRGAPITYGLTILERAPHRAAAEELVALLLGEPGQSALLRVGFRPLRPAASQQVDLLPETLQPLVARATTQP
ncbi:MAG: extracellular solute-binding protein [Deltaproteobacteria bacterium]|nr:extracellular solute-binding protein [Deltaproteobacteria bacterium]